MCVCGIQNGASFRMPLGPLHPSVRLNLNRRKSLSTHGPQGQGIRVEGRKDEKTSQKLNRNAALSAGENV